MCMHKTLIAVRIFKCERITFYCAVHAVGLSSEINFQTDTLVPYSFFFQPEIGEQIYGFRFA